ncbi:MAG: 8-amino-7-oxononanoate synthase [Syntrophus sp. SKADARSKE-3]|nr:8-amino-7-oxononanoate synthase [Syntrophus sp. SKADARSKE-3]
MNLFEKKMEDIKARGLYRRMRYLESPQESHVRMDGRDFILLSSNSYLGLCHDERLRRAAVEAAEKYGVGSGGSRLTTGSYEIHRQLETSIAAFKGTEAALIFNTGYMANVGTISALADREWVIFSDSLNHASIIDGCRLSGAETVVYDHVDTADLERKIKAHHRGRPALIVTDGIFSVDGDIAPLPDIVAIAQAHGILVMVDDAHATGVLGPNGGGTSDLFSLHGAVDIQLGTLSKALAGEGGFVAARKVLIDYLINRARSFIFSTALSPVTIAVALEALGIIRQEPEARERLLANALWFQDRLRAAGFKVMESRTPIISLVIGEAEAAVLFSGKLYERGVFVTAIRPPTVPPGTSRLRISLMATHTRADLEKALSDIEAVGRELGVSKP